MFDFTDEEIENKIMKYLYSTPNVEFTQFALYNKLLLNELKDDEENYFIENSFYFKKRMINILRTIDKYEDVIICKKKNYYSVILKNSNNKNKISKYNEVNNSSFDDDNFDYFDYLCNDFFDESFNIIDKNGNTIYHDMALLNKKKIIEALIDKNMMDFFFIENNDKIIPLELLYKKNKELYSSIMEKQIKILKLENKKIKLQISNLENNIWKLKCNLIYIAIILFIIKLFVLNFFNK